MLLEYVVIKPRRKFQVVSLSDAAAEKIRAIMASTERPFAGLRVGVKNGGCAGMSYTMEYAEAVLFLLGTEMDYKTDKMASQFVFNNPNQTSACGCGESVAFTPAAENTLEASA